MRHLGSILLSIVLAPVVYLLAGIGEIKLAGALGDGKFHLASVVGVAALLGAGLLYALLVQSRLSPLGPILAGLAYLVVEIWALVAQDSLGKLLPKSVFGVQGAAVVPLGGLVLLLAVPLLATVISPRRWRRYAQPRPAAGPTVAPYPGTPGYTAAGGYPPPPPYPGYSSPVSGGPSSDAGPGYPAPDSAPPGSNLPQPAGVYSPQMGSYAPPSTPPPAPLWPGSPGASPGQEPPDPESTRRL